MKKLLILASMILGFSSVSHADLLLEPYLGYDMAKYSGDNIGGGTQEGKPTGTTLGVRVAYKIPMFWFGLDGSSGSGKFNPESGTNGSYGKTVVGLVAGVDFPILLRAWAGYGFSNTLANKDTANQDLKGTNFKLGVGFTGLPFVSVNLEMVTDKFDKIGDSKVSDVFSSFNSSSYLLSVSLPLVF